MRSNKPEKIGIITRREYQWLKSFKSLEPHEQKKIDEYEKLNAPRPVPQVIKEKKEVKKIQITKGLLWKNFKTFYKHETGKEFIEHPDAIKNIEPIIKYFAYDESFFDCDNLVKDLNKPSFKKGLLIIGKFGNGKTTVMKTLGFMFSHFGMPMKYTIVNAHELVSGWESLQSPGDRSLFFEKYLCNSLYVDDVKKERRASNFGKSEVVRDILEKRYDKKLLTHITCNFRETDHVGDIKDALQEFNRYGNHIYDRLFEMFNIIKFTGKSFRE